jgi:DNA-binding GntR family transcriptional regulator
MAGARQASNGASTQLSEYDVSSLARFMPRAVGGESTAELVTAALREAILDGAMTPGTWLREDSISRDLGVSRTPVREALRRLSGEGFVTRQPHAGSVVAALSVSDIEALYIVRADLEALAARLAAENATSALIGRLRSVNDDMNATLAEGDAPKLRLLNYDFHRTLREAGNNSYLERFLTQVEHGLRRIASRFDSLSRWRDVVGEHEEIIAAIEEHDARRAAEAAFRHIIASRNVHITPGADRDYVYLTPPWLRDS